MAATGIRDCQEHRSPKDKGGKSGPHGYRGWAGAWLFNRVTPFPLQVHLAAGTSGATTERDVPVPSTAIRGIREFAGRLLRAIRVGHNNTAIASARLLK